MEKVEKIISPSWIFLAEEGDEVLKDHSIVVSGGAIHDVVPTSDVFQLYEASEAYQLSNHLILPGFINAHSHSAMSLLKGYADDLPLNTWLNDHIWPAENQHVSFDFVKDGSTLAIAEMIKGGTTTFNDMYFFPEATAEVVSKVGIRANIGLGVLDFPTNYANDPEDYLTKGFAFRDQWRDHKLITTCLAPHAPYTISNKTFELINTYAEQLDLGIHMHLHETRSEVEDSIKAFGITPIQRMQDLGVLGPKLMAAHCVHVSEADAKLLSVNGVSAICNISSNMKLGSGIPDINQLLQRGINVALGTDSSASNNALDMMREMRALGLVSKGLNMRSEFLKPAELIRMATINGAKALGLDELTGSISKGKRADMIAINLDTIESQPCYEPLSSFMYSADRSSIEYVWIDGNTKLKQGQLVCLDEEDILQRTKIWQTKIKRI
ncbi:MAG: N-ethylammeline chlorohydrolase [Methylophilales bacterium BACL14 MAG-120910-bin43]|jgi:5-methylthioadenosine/S-adenosylhomocysteine deaminase|nr:MAG: N-ethylammeline chlorohydrolase [Methylophilales bacterium BACL14 MAG-120910-bin43]KRP07789.1 MAG: N-ethylammeline chlorohydrolase [Methylophilales bacterium BACL14 MAG-120920-bin58]|tara:strand:- start:311 stop:1627 length:1317 start_codon:yes stop_codon:yes gene_type:complete